MDMRKLVGRNFARLRREKGLTQEEVEARSGFSQQYLSSLERGRRNPTVITLYELAQALGVSHLEFDVPLSFHPAATRVLGLVIRPRFLEHPRLEFSGPSQGDRLAMSPGFISVIGVLLPMAPWGRSSL